MDKKQKSKKICWIQHASEWSLVVPVARHLTSKGFEVVFVCKTRLAHEKFMHEGFESHYISDFFHTGATFSEDDLHTFDITYGPPYISEIMNSDVLSTYYFGEQTKSYQQLIARIYSFWETFLTEQKVDFFIARESATFLTRTAYTIAKTKQLPFAQFAIGPNEQHFTLDDVDEEHIWSDFIAAIQNGPYTLTEVEKKVVEDIVDAYKAEMREGFPLRYVPESLSKTIKTLVGLLRVDTKQKRIEEPMLVAASKNSIQNLLKRMQWKWFTKSRFVYDRPADEPFVYFPFYSGNETSYLSRNHYWGINQLSLIKEVAASLPHGHYLYVKEHPVNPGYFTYRELRSLQKIPNIKVLEPTVHSWDLIIKCAFVFVLQGTVGWEAILVKKPVVCLGRPFYSYASFVHNVYDISDLTRVISKALQVGSRDYQAKEEEWFWFIHTVFSTAGKGVSVLFKPPYGFPSDEENAAKIASYIEDWTRKHD